MKRKQTLIIVLILYIVISICSVTLYFVSDGDLSFIGLSGDDIDSEETEDEDIDEEYDDEEDIDSEEYGDEAYEEDSTDDDSYDNEVPDDSSDTGIYDNESSSDNSDTAGGVSDNSYNGATVHAIQSVDDLTANSQTPSVNSPDDEPLNNDTAASSGVPSTTFTVRIASGKLNLRSEASQTASVLTVLQNGDTGTYIEDDGEWAKVIYNDMTGYVSLKYITISR